MSVSVGVSIVFYYYTCICRVHFVCLCQWLMAMVLLLELNVSLFLIALYLFCHYLSIKRSELNASQGISLYKKYLLLLLLHGTSSHLTFVIFGSEGRPTWFCVHVIISLVFPGCLNICRPHFSVAVWTFFFGHDLFIFIVRAWSKTKQLCYSHPEDHVFTIPEELRGQDSTAL